MNQTISDLLLAYERAMNVGNWVEPLNPMLASLPSAQAFWKPSPEEHSIAAIVVHLSQWAEWGAGFLLETDRDVEEWPVTGPATEENWDQLRKRLTDSYLSLMAAMETLTVPDLAVQPVPEVTSMTRLQAILSLVMHAAYHSGQIVKLCERHSDEQMLEPSPAAEALPL